MKNKCWRELPKLFQISCKTSWDPEDSLPLWIHFIFMGLRAFYICGSHQHDAALTSCWCYAGVSSKGRSFCRIHTHFVHFCMEILLETADGRIIKLIHKKVHVAGGRDTLEVQVWGRGSQTLAYLCGDRIFESQLEEFWWSLGPAWNYFKQSHRDDKLFDWIKATH